MAALVSADSPGVQSSGEDAEGPGMNAPNPTEAFCRLHRRTFDPTKDAACPVCRGVRETPPTQKMPWAKVSAALIALVLAWTIFGGDRSADADAATAGPRMRINLYQGQIQNIEGLLYAENTRGEAGLNSLVAETQRLASMMKENESRLSMTPLILDIQGYADFLVQRASRGGFDAAAIEDARLEWERVRAHVFENDEPAAAE
jgi:hypothetical protein